MLMTQCINIVCRLIQLVESVGMTSSEISGANILNTLLYSNNNNNKVM